MSSPLKDLIHNMMGFSRDGVIPSIQAFPPLDIEQIATELRLDDRASEDGQREQPPSDGTVENLTELDIASEVERRARKGGEDYRSQLDLYEGRIRRELITTDQSANIEAAGKSALTDFKIQAFDDLDQLHFKRMEVEGRDKELRDFRHRHQLASLPIIVSTREKIARLLIIGIILLAESILNGMFFAEGSSLGLIGGVTQAFVLSALNIGGALLYACYGMPLLRHISQKGKATGVASTIAYAIWVCLLNLLIAHFRDLFIQSKGVVLALDIWNRLSTMPFSLTDSQSWLLAALGVGLSLLALIEASGLDDPYPGYGAIGRRWKEAISYYADDKAKCLAGMTTRRDEAIAGLMKAIELMRSAEYELRLAVEGRSRLHQNYCAFLSHLTDGYQRLLRRYYEVNTRHRNSTPPARFLNKPAPLAALTPPTLVDLPDWQDMRRHAIGRMEHFIETVNDQFAEVADKYHTVTTLTTICDTEDCSGLNA